MIDTIKLTCDIEKFPSQIRFIKNQKGVIKSIFNPAKEQKSTGKYFPRITFIKQPMRGGLRQRVQIELSIPKLLYGDNFSEVCDADFNDVVDALRYAIWQLDIGWRPERPLEEFRVTRIDYRKNIIFSDGTTVAQIIKLFNTSSVSKAIDISNGEFRNGGQILHLHTGRRDIAFYDKIFRTIPKMPLDSATTMNQLLGLLANPEAKPQRALATMGALRLYEEPDFDERFVREVFDKRFKPGSWNRSKKLLLQPEAPKNLQHLLQIEQTIREMRPLKLEDIRMM